MKECAYDSLEGTLQKEANKNHLGQSLRLTLCHQENNRHKCCSPYNPFCKLLQQLFGVIPLSSLHSVTPD